MMFWGYTALMPYAAVFMGIAFVSIILALPTKKKRENFLAESAGKF